MSLLNKSQKIWVKRTVAILAIISFIVSAGRPQMAEAVSLADLFSLDFVNAVEPSELPTSSDREPVRMVWVVVTAYSSTSDQTDNTPCIAAKGFDLCKAHAEFGEGNTIAANFLPINKQIKLPELFGDKTFVVRDRMNERYGNGRIDVWMPTREMAKEFGVKRVKMEIY
ncbi:MAG: 3D domain-containing protein [Candidatus Magasanikbacteria bacterium]|nr:3D domain-containing protein [Candidatus Magasanikbacteria bacterium]